MPIPLSSVGKIEKACGGDLRPSLMNPYLRIAETVTGRGKTRKVERTGTLCASDSFIAVMQNSVAVDDDETEGIVPLAALKFARGEKGSAVRLVGDRAIVVASGKEIASFPRGEISGNFPDLAKLLPEGDPGVVVALNPRLLLAAAEALGCSPTQGLRIEIREPLKPFVVSVISDPARQAIVMPIRVAG